MNLFSHRKSSAPAPRRARQIRLLVFTVGLLTLGMLSARSVIIPHDAILGLPGTPAPPPGRIIAQVVRPFVITNSVAAVVCKGNLVDRVWQEAATGHLDYFQLVSVNPGWPLPITSVARFNYPPGAVLNVDSLIGPGNPPNPAVRCGNQVTFEFNAAPVFPGQNSRWFFIDTTNPNFWPGGITVLQTPDGSDTAINTFAPK